MYSEKVMDHFQHPRNVGEIENASGVGTVGNAKCGDIMRIFLDIDDETHIIRDCKFKTFGCGAAVATLSLIPICDAFYRNWTGNRIFHVYSAVRTYRRRSCRSTSFSALSDLSAILGFGVSDLSLLHL